MSGYGDGWMFLFCFAYTLVSAVLPWINAEALVVSLPLMASSRTELLALILVATAGQMLGKCAVYWSGRGAGSSPPERLEASIERWRGRFARRPSAALGMVFVSSAVGLPPFYVMSLLAGALKLDFVRFLASGTCGRLVRFGVLALCSQSVVALFR